MRPILKLATHFEEIVGAILLAAMCLVAMIQVAGRYLLASPPAWTEEMATLFFAWLVFVGSSLALKRHEHFALEVAVEQLPRIAQSIIQFVVLVLLVVFCAILVVYGAGLAIDNWSVKTAVLEIPRTWLYAAVPFGGLLMFVRTIELFVRWWFAPPTEGTAGEESA